MKREDQLIPWKPEEKPDRNQNGLDDELEPPDVDVEASRHEYEIKRRLNTSTSPILSGGDEDADWAAAESAGDETVGGSTATPEQNDVDLLGRAVGVTYQDDEELHFGEKEHDRDVHRWELDPASSDDWSDRRKSEK